VRAVAAAGAPRLFPCAASPFPGELRAVSTAPRLARRLRGILPDRCNLPPDQHATVWIVHREDRARAALVRLAGSLGRGDRAPSDPIFDAAPAADVVVLGLAGDWEAELEFAHRQRSRLARRTGC
jgi:hypothetical protein